MHQPEVREPSWVLFWKKTAIKILLIIFITYKFTNNAETIFKKTKSRTSLRKGQFRHGN